MTTLREYVTSEEESYIDYLYDMWDWFYNECGYRLLNGKYEPSYEGFDKYIADQEQEAMQTMANKFNKE